MKLIIDHFTYEKIQSLGYSLSSYSTKKVGSSFAGNIVTAAVDFDTYLEGYSTVAVATAHFDSV